MPRVVALTPTGAVQGWSGETSSPGDENGSLCGRLGTEELPVPSLNTRWHEIIGHIWASISEKLSFKSKCKPFKDADTHSAIQVIGLKLHLHPSFLVGKKVIDVAAGSTHCLALTEDSEVRSWRSNDQCQHFDTLRVTKPEPAALPGLDAKHIVGITCGPAQSCAWSSCSEWSIGLRVPFGVDICSVTFKQLDLLLQQVSEGMDGSADWPPPQEKECVAVAMLNLPRLQLHAAISHQVDPEFLGLGLGSVLLNSLKQTVVTPASSTGVLSTVHSASQAMLQSGWSVLLPTAKKQARALSALLPCAVQFQAMK
ncbi:E3 ubiquitin-protein ligase HERC2-like [Pongo abelii]|uniref:E3 ubiquitin-protein ligase HERC2-like n=1 Tax=Pongo abelii TaxID=9601 RepID=UPI0023E8E737|nr:E3 ubiquitin-protein ligase HERC2-like [Pongo abelii]